MGCYPLLKTCPEPFDKLRTGFVEGGVDIQQTGCVVHVITAGSSFKVIAR